MFGNEQTQIYAMIAMVISILTFYLKLYPLIKKMDNKDQIDPKGYSKTLAIMIFSIIVGFLIAYLTRIV
jgi:hypothetical protein